MFYFYGADGAPVYGLPSHVTVAERNPDGTTKRWESDFGVSDGIIMQVEFAQADGDELDFALALLGLAHMNGKRVRTFVGDQARTIAANI